METGYYGNILEEELKNKVGNDLFGAFDTTQIIGRVDFCVSLPADPLGLNETESLLWAEAKKGASHDIDESFIQLILTLGKERPQDRMLPPAFLGAFDAAKIAFLPYNAILDVLRQNDFNWNVAPSDHGTKEFRQLKALLADALHHGLEVYDYEKDAKELAHFIRQNFIRRKLGAQHIRINKNNFTHIYLKWLDAVKPTINIDWEAAKRAGIIDADFYLADILSKDNQTLGEKLFVLLQDDHYLLDRQVNDLGLENFTKVQFNDNQRAHTLFWNRYARPPRREYWDDIVNRRDLLVPQDVRERKGSFFTPARWVELSQQYIAAELGEDWQEEYYVWDCCAGTGNLLAGLTNKYHIYASTLDKADVQAMMQRIDAMNKAARDGSDDGGANLLESHVFQFDFLNDTLLDETDKAGNVIRKSKLPKSLQDIIRNPEKRKRLVIYINPPYGEAASTKTKMNIGGNKEKIARDNRVFMQYGAEIGSAANELYALFLIRLYHELKGCHVGCFSTLKELSSSNFNQFRNIFKASLRRMFIVPANTFDNVTGKFPIGFLLWNTSYIEPFKEIMSDVYDREGMALPQKFFFIPPKNRLIIDWLRAFYDKFSQSIGWLRIFGTDIQNNDGICILSSPSDNDFKKKMLCTITDSNIFPTTIYYCARRIIEDTWINHRDQYLFPTDGWQDDKEFQADCLVYALFHGQNRISSEHGVNHWIPFTEAEVDAKEEFESHFMSDLLRGKHHPGTTPPAPPQGDLFADARPAAKDVATLPHPLSLSPEAEAVMAAGRALYRYYHRQPHANPNASFYDIRLHFQGTKTTRSGKMQMNADSPDTTYTALLSALREAMRALSRRIEPKVYAYGFLKQ
ncbi:MAG: hypothetical protein IJK87_14070 [Prevotella sp.]|nr:hypothetical protein [Prevotella sp.]